jgi:hypothetical protein
MSRRFLSGASSISRAHPAMSIFFNRIASATSSFCSGVMGMRRSTVFR